MMDNFARHPNRTVVTIIVAAACALNAINAQATIAGSPHDLRAYLGLGSGAEICNVCHTPHDANGNIPGGSAVTEAPLWNHTVTTATFTMYGTNGTLTAIEDPSPSGPSKLCLSCHDGTVAVDDYGGGQNISGPISNQETFYLGTDLRGKHPISITYDNIADPSLHSPTNSVTVGGYNDGLGTILPTKTGPLSSIMLTDGKVQCNSCHDVHNTFVATAQTLLRINQIGSALCLTCHNI